MIRNILAILSLTFVQLSHAASFDCKKASTNHEKLICNNPELSEADSQLGDMYRSALKNFKYSELIKEDQRLWLSGYRSCGVLVKCLFLIKNRLIELNKYQKASIYTDYKENKFIADGGTIVIFDELGVKTARFLGNWMPDAYTDLNKIKGYPFDGNWCDVNIELLKKGHMFVPKDSSDEFSLIIDASKIIMKGFLSCSPRTGFGEGTYLKR